MSIFEDMWVGFISEKMIQTDHNICMQEPTDNNIRLSGFKALKQNHTAIFILTSYHMMLFKHVTEGLQKWTVVLSNLILTITYRIRTPILTQYTHSHDSFRITTWTWSQGGWFLQTNEVLKQVYRNNNYKARDTKKLQQTWGNPADRD